MCSSLRGAAVDKCNCDELDFVAAKTLNKEGINQFVQDRTTIGSLNDRLVRLIELVRTNAAAPRDTSALSFPSCSLSFLYSCLMISSVVWAVQARCFEVENESLERHIVELEENLNNEQTSSSITSTGAEPDYRLDAVAEKLRKERVGGCCSWACPLNASLCDGMLNLGFLIDGPLHFLSHLIPSV